MLPGNDLEITSADVARMSGKPLPSPQVPPIDPAKEIEDKVATRVAEAILTKVIDQATLNLVGERLAVNKALQKEAAEIFDPVIAAAHESHKKAIGAKKKVTDPLTQEERLLKLAIDNFLAEQERIERARQEVLRIAREAEERRWLAEAEAEAKIREAEANALLQQEHEAEVERALESLPFDTPADLVESICNSPAPEPIRIAVEVPNLPPVPREAPSIVMPQGMSRRKTYKAEVVNLALLCRAIADGKTPTSYVTANMTALNARARADELSMTVPGVRAVEDSGIGQRTR